MANTYTQIHLQIVFSVKNRESRIDDSWKDELYKYMTGIIQNHEHKVLAINGMPDHLHIFIGIRPSQSLSNLVQDIKGDSSKWVNQKRFLKRRFSWQEGYGAFSYSRSHVEKVINYIRNQQIHHRKKSFSDEYIEILKKFEVSYNERYLFKPVD